MLVTEEEAKERWCPSTYRPNYGITEAAHAEQVKWTRCVASQCMAWRWQPLQADQPFLDAVKKRMDDSKDKHPAAVKYVRANLAEFDLPDKPFRGYCGLAGTP